MSEVLLQAIISLCSINGFGQVSAPCLSYMQECFYKGPEVPDAVEMLTCQAQYLQAQGHVVGECTSKRLREERARQGGEAK